MPERREALALRYDTQQEKAPRLLAKGQGSIADRIKELAREHGIPLYEDRDLVTLLGVLELDAEIPPRLYSALAEVLAQLYRVEQELR